MPTDNLQDLMYSLAVKKMYPKYKERNSEFLFLRFPLGEDLMGVPEKGLMRMETIPSEELERLRVSPHRNKQIP